MQIVFKSKIQPRQDHKQNKKTRFYLHFDAAECVFPNGLQVNDNSSGLHIKGNLNKLVHELGYEL